MSSLAFRWVFMAGYGLSEAFGVAFGEASSEAFRELNSCWTSKQGHCLETWGKSRWPTILALG